MRRRAKLLTGIAYCALAAGQTFDLASIHTRTDGTGDVYTLTSVQLKFTGPRVIVENFRLHDLIAYAYAIKGYELLGQPRWADIDRYDISAEAPAGPSPAREAARPVEADREMMRALLADRFQLKVHKGTKEMAVYALVADKGGPKLRKSLPGTEKRLTLESRGKTSLMTVTGGDMAQLAEQFSKLNGVDRPVIDKTGLTGIYDYQLEFGDDTAIDADPGTASIFTVFRSQLGLRLEPARAPIQVLIVDHAEKPSEN